MDIFNVLTMIGGLCLFLFVMSARGFVFMGYEHIGASSVIVAAVLAVVLARFWPGFSLATIYRVLLPVAAAIFIVLSSFPVGTMSFSLGFLVSHSVMATVALLALASLAAVARAGEFSPVVVGAALCAMTSVAVLVGSNLAQLVPQDDTMGAVLLACAMAYFVYILISPLADYYRMFRETDGAEDLICGLLGTAFKTVCIACTSSFFSQVIFMSYPLLCYYSINIIYILYFSSISSRYLWIC